MVLYSEIEVAEGVVGEGVRPALHHDHGGLVHCEDIVNYSLEQLGKREAIDAFQQRHIQRIVRPLPVPCVTQCPCSREEVPVVLVEAHCHHSVCAVERLFHSIAMMDVDVDVEHSLVSLQ